MLFRLQVDPTSVQLTVPMVDSECTGDAEGSLRDSVVMTATIRIREDITASPICPHCGKELQEIAARRVECTLGVRFLYYCCHCLKVLGVSHRKGFWMG